MNQQPIDYQFAVLGDPIAHSKSPIIHQQFAAQHGLNIRYDKIHVTVDDLEAEINRLHERGYTGINITVPHKSKAFDYLNQIGILDQEASKAKAINTIKFTPTIQGANTDGRGLIQDIKQRLNITLNNAQILVIGAGGASWGIMGALLTECPKRIWVVNRTKEKSERLANAFEVDCISWSQLSACKPDLIINATTSSLHKATLILPDSLLTSLKLAYDLMYSEAATSFETWAQRNSDIQTSNGCGMLVEQAALAFSWWTGKTVDTGTVEL